MPLEVLKEVQDEFLDFNGTGMSIVEISHRSAAYQAMQDDTVAMLKKLLPFPTTIISSLSRAAAVCSLPCMRANFLRRAAGI